MYHFNVRCRYNVNGQQQWPTTLFGLASHMYEMTKWKYVEPDRAARTVMNDCVFRESVAFFMSHKNQSVHLLNGITW